MDALRRTSSSTHDNECTAHISTYQQACQMIKIKPHRMFDFLLRFFGISGPHMLLKGTWRTIKELHELALGHFNVKHLRSVNESTRVCRGCSIYVVCSEFSCMPLMRCTNDILEVMTKTTCLFPESGILRCLEGPSKIHRLFLAFEVVSSP